MGIWVSTTLSNSFNLPVCVKFCMIKSRGQVYANMLRCLALESKGECESYPAFTTTSCDIKRARGHQMNTCPREAGVVDKVLGLPKPSLSAAMLPKAASV